jgi:hypothetical protein
MLRGTGRLATVGTLSNRNRRARRTSSRHVDLRAGQRHRRLADRERRRRAEAAGRVTASVIAPRGNHHDGLFAR